MFRADESSMFEDKNLPSSNCYSPSKCSKLAQHVLHKYGHHQSSNLSTSGPQGSSPLNHFAKSATLSFNQATQFKGLTPIMVDYFIEESSGCCNDEQQEACQKPAIIHQDSNRFLNCESTS